MKVGVFVGRFQPFHNGHLFAVHYALERVDFLYIVVGSAHRSHERENPFTAGERVEMIKATLDDVGLDPAKWMIIPVPDAESHSVWVSMVRSFVPRFDMVFSNDSLTNRLFREDGLKVKPVPFDKRADYSATNVRTRILEKKNWESLVPKPVAKLVKQFDGVARVRSMTTKDLSGD